MVTRLHLPTLQTLHTKPSWHNRAGRVDRSACFVLTASQHWRAVPEDGWTYRSRPSSNASTDKVSLMDQSQFARRGVARRLPKGLCDRYADLTFWARDLWELHRCERPYPLQGDFRTAKSNALKAGPGAQWVRKDRILGDGPVNPNRGTGFDQYKMLGLDAAWQTTVRIERIVQHERLRQHFFACPVCEGRCTKLYLPLCTEREYEDAQVAQLWIDSHINPNRPLSQEAARLIERYGELFEPRRLRCRQCLGLRYGEVK